MLQMEAIEACQYLQTVGGPDCSADCAAGWKNLARLVRNGGTGVPAGTEKIVNLVDQMIEEAEVMETAEKQREGPQTDQ